MSKKSSKYFFLIGIVAYIIVGIWAINYVTNWISSEYYDLIGTKALDIAKISRSKFSIEDKEVEELKALTFEESQKHPANIRFSNLFLDADFSKDFKYAYVMVELKTREVKYYVTKEDEKYYDSYEGKALDLLWLLDVVINKDQRMEVEQIEDYYKDKNRYSILRKEGAQNFYNEKDGYVFVGDEYGNSITGMIPIYSIESNFVGLLGVDIYFENFEAHTASVRLALLGIFILPSVMLTIIYIFAYIKKSIRSNKDAHTDPLTSLFNRRYLALILPKLVNEAYQKSQPMSAIMLDIDCFKNYNDNYGHSKGDEIIIMVAKMIKVLIRSNTDVVCRYGGEEFLILLPNTDISGAKRVAVKIKEELEKLDIAHDFSECAKYITVSQGIYSEIPEARGKKQENEFIVNADNALYAAKQGGRNRYEIYENKKEIK